MSFLLFAIRWHSSACLGICVGWREGLLDESTSRKPLLLYIFALNFYANKMWRFYSKCVNTIEYAKDACLNPGWRTDIQGQEERGERARMEEEWKSLPTLACLNYEFHLFMHFVLAHCNDDFFGIMAHTDPVLWPLLGEWLSCRLSPGHDERFQKQRGDCPDCGVPSLMSPIPSLNPFSSDYLILCLIEGPVAHEGDFSHFLHFND